MSCSLFLSLKANTPSDTPIYLDSPTVNIEAVNLAKRHNMTPVFETARMYIGQSPDLSLNRMFGITSFELG